MNKICFLFFVVVFFACSKEFHYPVNYEPLIVINGVLAPGRKAQVLLSSNVPKNELVASNPLTNAKVTLSDSNNNVYELLHDSVGIYSANIAIEYGVSYTINAQCEGFPKLEASTTVPLFENVSASTQHYDERFDLDYQVDISMPASPESYYATRAFWSQEVDTTVYYYFPSPTYSFEDGKVYRYVDMDWREIDSNVEFFNNAFQQGKRKKEDDFLQPFYLQHLKVFYPNDREKSAGNPGVVYYSNSRFAHQPFRISMPQKEIMLLMVYQLSPELYKSFKSYAAQEAMRESYFLNSVSVYNSVNNGAGYFGSMVIHYIDFRNN